MPLAGAWLDEAMEVALQRNPNSMTISTVDVTGQPSSRVVLCKQFVPDPGYLVFYTNYRSQKAEELRKNGRAAALFHWDALGRQIRLQGEVVCSPAEESDTYFESRDRASQLGAWGSDQSQPIASREALATQVRERMNLSGSGMQKIKRPPHWGGYRLWVSAIELWVEGADRIHDRGQWSRSIVRREEASFETSDWTSTRLQP